ncbi:DUF1642 domain-containing protein [Streptococcus dysgalactiae]|uniref:DUF1642 domain-containing protein n=1 Tax=Streptococcus dysgalactiae TaxID=1334 RepID=UPI000617C2F3|nr:DUF1642 domain-containing protein [Streptococcus dysgalactiae]KKC16959.1 hypothetical protein WH81_07255 [Streptococcus dysgalactiae subsp. equisimilis]
MNINEVLYLPVKREGLNIGPDEFFCKRRYRTLDGDEVASSFKAKTKEELLDQQKPEIPRFVANWIEDQKQSFDDSSAIDMYENLTLDNHGGYYHDVWLWAIDHHNDFVFAWTYGYTVKKEKKYKVRDKRLSPNKNYLNFDKNSECWLFSNALSLNASHTRKALEESGFNVFDDDNYEVTEVAE